MAAATSTTAILKPPVNSAKTGTPPLNILSRSIKVGINASPTAALVKSISLLNRLIAACPLFDASIAASPYVSCSLVASLGNTSADITLPSCSILSNSAVVIPIASAVNWNAPGNLSPNCPRNSSACIFPLDIICDRARNTPLACSVGNFSAVVASATAENTRRVSSPSIAVFLVEAENFAYASVVSFRFSPNRSLSSLTYCSSLAAALLLPIAEFMVNVIRSIARDASMVCFAMCPIAARLKAPNIWL